MRGNDIKIFMTDFFVFSTTFEDYLQNLSVILKRCIKIKLILIWKKYQALVQEESMPRHIISKTGIGIDQAIIEKNFKLSPPISTQQIPFLLDFGTIRS